ncbi:MAG: DNA primase small subunit domain-containing protein [Candidatus Anstonellales archaeon]
MNMLFKEYYKSAEIQARKVSLREFGVGNLERKIAVRHLSFKSNSELNSFLRNGAPFYISYSASLYKQPWATPMESKGRIGCELIFDIDGKECSRSSIAQSRDALIKLMNIIEEDFGLSKNDYLVFFSGNRGFHLHVIAEDYLPLSSDSRRQIADYLTCASYADLFRAEPVGRSEKIIGPSTDDMGQKGRIARAVFAKFGKIKGNNWTLLKPVEEKVLSILPQISVPIDAAVTTDLSKLIRMPLSLHGSTGLIVKNLDDPYSFDPFNDAVVKTKSTALFTPNQHIPSIEFGGVTQEELSPSSTYTLNLSYATFLALRGKGSISC